MNPRKMKTTRVESATIGTGNEPKPQSKGMGRMGPVTSGKDGRRKGGADSERKGDSS